MFPHQQKMQFLKTLLSWLILNQSTLPHGYRRDIYEKIVILRIHSNTCLSFVTSAPIVPSKNVYLLFLLCVLHAHITQSIDQITVILLRKY